MKKLHALVVVLGMCTLLASEASAGPYFRFMGMKRDEAGKLRLHPTVGSGFNVDPRSPMDTAGITDLSIFTHDTADGSLIPGPVREYIPPFAWSPLLVWYGGSFRGELNGGFGTSYNVSPAIATWAMGRIGDSSKPWLRAIKTAMLAEQGKQFRIGVNFGGQVLKDGEFRSLKDAFPGQGFFDIMGRNAKISVGLAY